MILIGYDGSRDARAAIARAGILMPGYPAVALCVWDPSVDEPAPLVDEAALTACAAEGAALAHQAGIDCSPRTRPRVGSVADTILFEAGMLDARAIVLGLGGGPHEMGSVSGALLRGSDRPVLVVPADPLPVLEDAKRPGGAIAAR